MSDCPNTKSPNTPKTPPPNEQEPTNDIAQHLHTATTNTLSIPITPPPPRLPSSVEEDPPAYSDVWQTDRDYVHIASPLRPAGIYEPLCLTDDEIDDSIFDIDDDVVDNCDNCTEGQNYTEDERHYSDASTPSPSVLDGCIPLPTVAGIVAYLFRPTEIRVLPADPPLRPIRQLLPVPWLDRPFLPNLYDYMYNRLIRRPVLRNGITRPDCWPVPAEPEEKVQPAPKRGAARKLIMSDSNSPVALQQPQQQQPPQQQQQQQQPPKQQQQSKTDNNNGLNASLLADAHEMRPMIANNIVGTPSRSHRNAFKSLKKPPQPHMCIRERNADGEELFINVMSWTRIMMPASPEDPIPLYGGMKVSPIKREPTRIPDVFDPITLTAKPAAANQVPRCNQRSPPNVYAVMVNPEILKHVGRTCPDPDVSRYVEKTALVQLMSDFVEAMNPGLELSRCAEILVDRDLAGELKDIWGAVQAKRERDKETIQLGGVPTYSQAIANAAQRMQPTTGTPTSPPASRYPTVSSVPIATPAGPAATGAAPNAGESDDASALSTTNAANTLNNNAGTADNGSTNGKANGSGGSAKDKGNSDETDSTKAATTPTPPKGGASKQPSSPQTPTKKDRLGSFLPKICSNRIPFMTKKEKKTTTASPEPAAPVAGATEEVTAPVALVTPTALRIPSADSCAASVTVAKATTTASTATAHRADTLEATAASSEVVESPKNDEDLEKVNK